MTLVGTVCDWEEYKSKGNMTVLKTKFHYSDLCADPRESL